MLKKLFSLMLICVLILPVFGNVNAADIPGDIEYKANVLHELNIMPKNDNTNNQSNVSKSEFINYLVLYSGKYFCCMSIIEFFEFRDGCSAEVKKYLLEFFK